MKINKRGEIEVEMGESFRSEPYFLPKTIRMGNGELEITGKCDTCGKFLAVYCAENVGGAISKAIGQINSHYRSHKDKL
jgi:hypothetical protein